MTQEWKKAFTIEKERAQEYIELYESMGYDVRVVDAAECDLKDECRVCYLHGDYVEIFIKERSDESEGEQEK
jgi:cobyrinic acid a,c-diamide synthase